MRSWWQDRTGRERALLIALALVTVAAFLQFGVVSPMRAARAEAVAALADASDLLASVRSAAARGPAEAAEASPTGASLRETVIATGRARGLAITRLNPLDDGALAVRIDRTEARLFHQWLASLKRDAGVIARQVAVRRVGDGAVSADVTFVRTGS